MKPQIQRSIGNATWALMVIFVMVPGCVIDVDPDKFDHSKPKIFGSGRLTELEPDLGAFTRVEFREDLEAVLVQGDESRVSIQIDDNLVNYLVVRNSGDTLTVDLDEGFDYQDQTIIVTATMPTLTSIDADDSVVRFSGFDFDGPLDIFLDDSSVQGTSPMAFQNLTIDILDESSVTLQGKADFVSIVATEECDVNMMHTSARSASVSLDEESNATVNVSDTLSYDLNEESTLRYYGSPALGATYISEESSAIDLGIL